LILRFGHVRFVVVVIVVIGGRRSGRVAAVVLVVVHFDFETHVVAAVAVGVHVATVAGHAFERSATSAAIATVAVAAAAADVAAADIVSCTGDAGRRWNSGCRGRRLHHDRHQQPIVIVVGCRGFSRFPSRHLLDHTITVVALKVYEIKKLR